MPAYAPTGKPFGFTTRVLLVVFVGMFGYLIWEEPWVLCFVPLLMVWGYFDQKRRKKKFFALQEKRKEESICEFARSFDRRTVDTWIIRAVYEEIQRHVCLPGGLLPIHATDDLFGLLELDHDDLDMDIVEAIAQRTGRSLDGIESNPFAGKVETVGDLVHLFNSQPMANAYDK